MNYNLNYRRISRHNVRLAFELSIPHSLQPHYLWRIRFTNGALSVKREGIVLDCPDIKSRVAVANVRPGDVVMIAHSKDAKESLSYTGYHISEKFIPNPIQCAHDLFTQASVITQASEIASQFGIDWYYDQSDLRLLFHSQHPSWLQRYVDATLQSWRYQSLDTYLNNAPRKWLEDDLLLLAVQDPQRALADFSGKLTTKLREDCIRNLGIPESELQDKSLPVNQRPINWISKATYALRNHLHELSDQTLRNCAIADPVTAYRLRNRVTDDRRAAILLSRSYGLAWHTDRHTRGPLFRREILDSISNFPDEWIDASGCGLSYIFKRLKSLLDIQFETEEFIEMLRNIAPVGRRPLAHYLATLI